jgi:hypothetical protein
LVYEKLWKDATKIYTTQISLIISFILEARINLSSPHSPFASATATLPSPSTLVYDEGMTVEMRGVAMTSTIREVEERIWFRSAFVGKK